MVQSIPVTIFANIVGFFPAGIQINIDCSARKIEDEIINPAVGGGKAKLTEGGIWPDGAPEGFTTVACVKLNTPDGYIWMKASDYDVFLTQCNSCCVS